VSGGINDQTIKISVISIGGKYKRLLYIIIRRNTLCWLLVHNIHRVGPRCILNDRYLAHPVTFGQSWSFLFLHLFSGSSCHRLSLFPRCEVWVSPRSSIVPCVSYFFLWVIRCFPAKFHALFFRACNCSFRCHFFILFITRYPTIMIKFRHRVLDTSREIMDAVAALAGTCSSKCMRPLLYHEQSWGSVQKNATSSLLNTSAASVVTLEVAGLLSALCFEWILTLLFMLLLDNLKCFPSLLNFIFAWLTCVGTEWLFDLWSFIIFPDLVQLHGWSAIGRDFSHRGAVTIYWVCYQGYQMQCAHRTHSHPKNRLREHELVLVALLVFCASLGSWLHVSFLSFLRLLSSFLPSLGCWGSGHVWDCLKTLILFLLGIGCWLLFQRLWIWLWVAKHGVNARRVARRASPPCTVCLACALGTCGGGLQKNSMLSEGRGFYIHCVFGFLNVFRWWGRLLVWINASVWCVRRLEGP